MRFYNNFAAIPLEFDDQKYGMAHEQMIKEIEERNKLDSEQTLLHKISARSSDIFSQQQPKTPDLENCEWCQVIVNLDSLVRKSFGNNRAYNCTQTIQIHSCCRLQRVYFTDLNTQSGPVPAEFKLFATKIKK